MQISIRILILTKANLLGCRRQRKAVKYQQTDYLRVGINLVWPRFFKCDPQMVALRFRITKEFFSFGQLKCVRQY